MRKTGKRVVFVRRQVCMGDQRDFVALVRVYRWVCGAWLDFVAVGTWQGGAGLAHTFEASFSLDNLNSRTNASIRPV